MTSPPPTAQPDSGSGPRPGAAQPELNPRRRLPSRANRAAAAVTAAAVIAVVVAWAGQWLAALALAGYTAVLGWLSAIDLTERRLPNRIVGPLAAAVTTIVITAGLITGDAGRTGAALVAGLAASIVLLVLSVVGGVGMGDVKLAFPIGVVAGWLGLTAGQVTLITTTFAGGLVAAAMLLSGRGRETLPYGPFLALGAVAGLLVAGLA